MQLDVRLPIGFMFTILGIALVAFGLVSDRAIYERSLGININLWWGLVTTAFGLSMLALAAWSRRRRAASTQDQPKQEAA
jgi:membrane protein implicated in regulation of membrane protease activity